MDESRWTSVELTYEDYRLMPEGERYELIEGDLQLTPAPNTYHQRVSQRIERELIRFVEQHGLGEVLDAPVDVVLSNTNVVQPDILFVARDRLGIIQYENVQGAPDLVVEILSPSTAQRDLVAKRRIYARFGVQEYWIVDPDGKSIEVCVQTGRSLETRQVYTLGMSLESQLLAGLQLELKAVFPAQA